VRARKHVLWVAIAALAAAVPLLILGSAAAQPPVLSTLAKDTFTTPTALHESVQSGNMLAAGKMVVTTYGVGAIFDGGNDGVGFAVSFNGGGSWKDGIVPVTSQSSALPNAAQSAGPTSPAPYPLTRADHPSVAYDARDHTWLVSSIGLSGNAVNQGVFVNRSTSTASPMSWSQPVIAVPAVTGTTVPVSQWIACDNWPNSSGYGNCYLAWDNTASSPTTRLMFQESTDGGATWSAPVASADLAVGTGAVPLVQPPAAINTCASVIVPYTATTSSLGEIVSTDSSATCNAPAWGAHTVITTQAAVHTVAIGLKTSLLPSDAMDKAGNIYLAYQTRSFRVASTTLAAAASAGDTNVKLTSVTGLVAGQTLTIDPTGANPETVTITVVGTSGSAGTGVTFSPALAFAHASGAIVNENGVAGATSAGNDIALAVLPAGSTTFGAPTRIPIETNNGTANTNDHFIPAIAVDPNTSGATARIGLFFYDLPLAACQLDDPFNADHCMFNFGYVSSTDGGSTWSNSASHPVQQLTSGMSPAWLPRLSNGPSFGNYLGAAVVSSAPGNGSYAGHAFSAFAHATGNAGPVYTVPGFMQQELDVPDNGLPITGP
jgi:hypothetical protein